MDSENKAINSKNHETLLQLFWQEDQTSWPTVILHAQTATVSRALPHDWQLYHSTETRTHMSKSSTTRFHKCAVISFNLQYGHEPVKTDLNYNIVFKCDWHRPHPDLNLTIQSMRFWPSRLSMRSTVSKETRSVQILRPPVHRRKRHPLSYGSNW